MPIILILLIPRPRTRTGLRFLLLLLPLLPAAWEPLSLALNSLRSGIFAPFMASAIIDRATKAAAASIYAPHLFVYTWSRLRIIPGWNEACGPAELYAHNAIGIVYFCAPYKSVCCFFCFSVGAFVFASVGNLRSNANLQLVLLLMSIKPTGPVQFLPYSKYIFLVQLGNLLHRPFLLLFFPY